LSQTQNDTVSMSGW